MDSDSKEVLLFLGGFFAIVILSGAAMVWMMSRPMSQMEICIKAKYEWRGGDCVTAAPDAQ